MIETNLFINAGFTPEQSKKLFEEHALQVPLGKRIGSSSCSAIGSSSGSAIGSATGTANGTAREVAEAIGFLSDNEKASFITGQILKLDGGHGLLF